MGHLQGRFYHKTRLIRSCKYGLLCNDKWERTEEEERSALLDFQAKPVHRALQVSVDLADRKEVWANRVPQVTVDRQVIREGLERTVPRVQLDSLVHQDPLEKRVTKDQGGSSVCLAVKVLGGNEARQGKKGPPGYKEKRVSKGQLDQMELMV